MAQVFRRRWPGLSYGRGEDWHYVGEAGEPAFENSWANSGGGLISLAFRIREAGIVDIYGVVEGGTDLTVFTLPTGYRPSSTSGSMPIVTGSGGVLFMSVQADGAVRAPTGSGKVGFAHQIFLNLPAPP